MLQLREGGVSPSVECWAGVCGVSLHNAAALMRRPQLQAAGERSAARRCQSAAPAGCASNPRLDRCSLPGASFASVGQPLPAQWYSSGPLLLPCVLGSPARMASVGINALIGGSAAEIGHGSGVVPTGLTTFATWPPRYTRAGCRRTACPSAASGSTPRRRV